MKKFTLIFICILVSQLANAQETHKTSTPKKLTGITSGGGSKGYGIMPRSHEKQGMVKAPIKQAAFISSILIPEKIQYLLTLIKNQAAASYLGIPTEAFCRQKWTDVWHVQ